MRGGTKTRKEVLFAPPSSSESKDQEQEVTFEEEEISQHESGPGREEIDEELMQFKLDEKEYFDYTYSKAAGKRAESEIESSDVDEVSDSDALDSNFESSDESTESDSSDDEEQWPRRRGSGTKISAGSQNVKRKSSSACPGPPPPPPPLTRGSRTRRVCPENDQEEPGTSKSLIQLLRSRSTLNPALPGAAEQLNSSTPTFKVFGEAFEYAKRQKSMENWAVTLHSKIKEEPEEVLMDHFRQVFTSKLRKQMRKEWMHWAIIGEEGWEKSEFYPCWKTMLRKFVRLHPVWEKHSDQLVFNDLLEEAGFKSLATIDNLIAQNDKILQQINSWRSKIDDSMEKKLVFMKKFRSLEAEIENKDKKLDEFCHWGRKNLQSSFMAPYFKFSSKDYTHLVPSKNFMKNVYGDALITPKKQKWTTKDLQALKKAIVEVILDKEYAELMERYNYLASRIAHERALNQQGSSEQDQSIYHDSARGSGRKISTRRVNMKKRRGYDLSSTTIQRVIPVGIEGMTVKAYFTVKGTELQEWLQEQEFAFRRLTYESLMQDEKYIKQIDWFKVAERVTGETDKDRCANDCRLVWLHFARPDVCSKRWPAYSVKKLMELGQNGGKTMIWEEIAKEIGGKTAYQCALKYRNRVVQTESMQWDDEKDRRVKEVLLNEGPKWGKAVEATLDHRATKHQVQERWKKVINPILRHGDFTRVEDALLLLSVERLRGFLQKEGHFGIFMAYLPWRFETVWRDRANNLFSNWTVPWTIEEDRKLLELVKSQEGRKNWKEISEQFSSHKNRKGCLTRHKMLLSKLRPGVSKFKSLEEYHEAYSMTRYNVFECKHLLEVVELLKRIEVTQSPGPFRGLSKDRPPDELELRWLLLDYDKVVVKSAIQNLENYINRRNTYWKEWKETNELKRTFDRRTFHRGDPRSVASAVHIRGLKLMPKEKIDEKTDFESQIYRYYAQFKRTKALKDNTNRPYLPTAKKLRKLPEIKRIISPPSGLEGSDSGSDWDGEREFKVRKRGRPKKAASKQSTSVQSMRKTKRRLVRKTNHTETTSEESDNEKPPKKKTNKQAEQRNAGRKLPVQRKARKAIPFRAAGPDPVTSKVPKRGKGRVRKSQLHDEVVNVKAENFCNKGAMQGLGVRKSERLASIVRKESDSAGNNIKRKRGCFSKSQASSSAVVLEAESVSAEGEPPNKRPRGRQPRLTDRLCLKKSAGGPKSQPPELLSPNKIALPASDTSTRYVSPLRPKREQPPIPIHEGLPKPDMFYFCEDIEVAAEIVIQDVPDEVVVTVNPSGDIPVAVGPSRSPSIDVEPPLNRNCE